MGASIHENVCLLKSLSSYFFAVCWVIRQVQVGSTNQVSALDFCLFALWTSCGRDLSVPNNTRKDSPNRNQVCQLAFGHINGFRSQKIKLLHNFV